MSAATERALSHFLAEVELRGLPTHQIDAARLRQALVAARRPVLEPPAQASLWEVDETGREVPWRGLLGPEAPVRCDRYSTSAKVCVLPLKTCLMRQDAVWPGKKAPLYEGCQGCPQGAEYRKRTAYSAAADWASKSKHHRPAYQPFRKDAGLQRKTMRELEARARTDRVPTMDNPPPEEHEPVAAAPAPAPPAPAVQSVHRRVKAKGPIQRKRAQRKEARPRRRRGR